MASEPPTLPRFQHAVIVDDSGEFQQLAQMMLGYVGISRIMRYSRGGEALPALLDAPPDLLLLDQVMEDMDGVRLLNQLRTHPATLRLPVIICTAAIQSFLDHEERLRDDPYTLVLPKPFSIDELHAALRQFETGAGRA